MRELPSGAGHDAVTMAGVTDIAMLFVRCAGGISHNPGESVTDDVALAIEAAAHFRGSAVFDLIVRGGTVVTPSGRLGAPTSACSTARSRRSRRSSRARAEESTRPACTSSPAGWTRTCTSTSRAARTGKGIKTGSAALAAGGFTAFFDMPLNSLAADDRRRRVRRQAAGRARRRAVDFGLWGGAGAGQPRPLEELAERGVIGFKAFMSNRGIEEFLHADDVTLYEGMAICARLGLLVAVHAENDALTARPSGADARATGMDSRPVVAEVGGDLPRDHVRRDTGCALHIVHVSSARGVGLVTEARPAAST